MNELQSKGGHENENHAKIGLNKRISYVVLAIIYRLTDVTYSYNLLLVTPVLAGCVLYCIMAVVTIGP